MLNGFAWTNLYHTLGHIISYSQTKMQPSA